MPDGTCAFFRAVRPEDEPLLREMLAACSDLTIRQRFFSAIDAVPPEKVRELVTVDQANEVGIAGLVEDGEQQRMIALASYRSQPESELAEVAFLVQDEYQGQGLGTFLFDALAEIAQTQGLRGFSAEVLTDNHPMLRVFEKSAHEMRKSMEDSSYRITLKFSAES